MFDSGEFALPLGFSSALARVRVGYTFAATPMEDSDLAELAEGEE